MSSTRYDSSQQEEAKTPILAGIYNVIGVLWIIASAMAAFMATQEPDIMPKAIAAAAIAVFIGLVCFGIAQVVMLIAKIEFNTRPADSFYTMMKLLTEISRNTASSKSASQ